MLNDGNVGVGDTLTVDGSTFGTHDKFMVDGSAETDGSFVFLGGGGHNVLSGGAGNDNFNFGGNFAANDRVSGGSGNDTLTLNGDYSHPFKFGASTISGIEILSVAAGHDYNFILKDPNVAAGDTFIIRATALNAANSLTVKAASEGNGSLVMVGGAGNNSFIGGKLDDTLNGGDGNDMLMGGRGADQMNGGLGDDTFAYRGAAESNGTAYDTVVNFDALEDHFDISQKVTGIDATVRGQLSAATLDGDLKALLGTDELGAKHAVVVKGDSGDLAKELFLVVDMNGTAGYQAGSDLVVNLSSADNIDSLDVSDFI